MYSLNSSINVNFEKERLEFFANPIKHCGTLAQIHMSPARRLPKQTNAKMDRLCDMPSSSNNHEQNRPS